MLTPHNLIVEPEPPRWVQRCLHTATNLALPPYCTCCGIELPKIRSQRPLLCKPCVDAFCTLDGQPCPRCASPVPAVALTRSNCSRCRSRKLYFQSAAMLGLFRGELRDAVLRTKLPAGEMLTIALGTLLADQLRERLAELPDLVAAVPMHWLRRLTRQSNSAELLAYVIGRRLGVRFVAGLLGSRRTEKQSSLTALQRLQNLRGAYWLARHAPVEDAHVLVIDDVMTTGATLNEAAKVIRRAGAARVSVAVLARAADGR